VIRVIAVGKRHAAWIEAGIERYEKRLRRPYDVEWVFLPHSQFTADRARQEESERILSRLKAEDFVILLDERGKNIDSPALSRLIEAEISHGRQIVVIIGGAYGVDDRLSSSARPSYSYRTTVPCPRNRTGRWVSPRIST